MSERKMKYKGMTIRIFGMVALASLVSCTQLQQKSAGAGALAGLALGAIAGDSGSDLVKGATIGAALGAGGAVVKEKLAEFELVKPSSNNSSKYPYATRTSNPNYVKSPYPPYRLMDVTGIASGKMAKEPGSSNIFLIP